MVRLFNRISIRGKVIAGFALVLACSTTVGLVAVQQLSAVNAEAADLRDNWLPSVSSLGLIAQNGERYRALQAGMVALTAPAQAADNVQRLTAILDAYNKAWAAYEPLITPGKESALANGIQATWTAYLKQSDQLEALSRAGRTEQASAL